MVNTVWLIKRPADFPEADLLEDNDMIILIQDAVLRIPSIENWLACEEDVKARNIKFPEDKLISYEDIIDIIEKAEKVIVW
ncbi:sulfurtransferase TusB [Hydrogenothermus marinus]|uniref:tRNA 2-thiouridine synthesizing protein B n=1 Tax=Hydrogenothermus marinus TaxID=133270 RepID=A0A3M0BKS0_9AQUI|nr:sulfurtransferase TusB [Hydrogenothermus marinus]RMA97034.1 tRNA 2-thiouridine synthesizing protein B [Hydrogenothermus marinus]